MLSWLAKNREVLTWIGGGVVALAAGAWTVVTYVWPHDDGGKSIVCAQGGSVAAGRDSSGNIIVINPGGSGTPVSSAPCVDTGRK